MLTPSSLVENSFNLQTSSFMFKPLWYNDSVCMKNFLQTIAYIFLKTSKKYFWSPELGVEGAIIT